ncbi:MAG: 50S ribosomal protein L25 [Myxococcota bacterium]
METTTLQAEVRSESGKGPARRLRAAGKLPAVIYGPGLGPIPLTVDPVQLRRTLEGPRGRNSVFTVPLDGTDHLAMVKDLVVEPVSRSLIHADFYTVSTDRAVVCEVPLTTTGRAAGVVAGGKLKQTRRTVSIRCTPDRIPESLTVDVTNLEIFEAIRVRDLTLEDGVECTLKPELSLVMVIENKRAVKDADEEAAAAGEGEG